MNSKVFVICLQGVPKEVCTTVPLANLRMAILKREDDKQFSLYHDIPDYWNGVNHSGTWTIREIPFYNGVKE